jgi:16S rRNA (cytidine1402-2'-O)-methyltransferase
MNKKNGKVYLIPCPLHDGMIEMIPFYVKELIKGIHCYFVEEERTARRYLKSIDKTIDISKLSLLLINEHILPDLKKLREWLDDGKDVGVISEAGCPGVADPGNLIVQEAHRLNYTVIPLVGPNSILLALMASGMNGQSFQFVGYIPVKQPARNKLIRQMELAAHQKNQTQVFMETPYRNNQLLQDIIRECKQETLLCIAADITGFHEFIKTASIREWKNNLPDIHKRPAIFLMGNFNR